jgi:uncharacterized protein (DUF1778 family)
MPAKTDRIETRVSADEKRQIDRAAALEGRTVSAFIVSAAVERAHEVLATRDATIVPADYFDRLLAAIDVPDSAPRLRRAARAAGRSSRIAR